jgi:hypothetical protein
VPFSIALKAASKIMEFLLLFISQRGKVGLVRHVSGIDVHSVKVIMALVLILEKVDSEPFGDGKSLGGKASFLGEFLGLEVL